MSKTVDKDAMIKDFKHLDTKQVDDGRTKSVMTLEATVDYKPQELRHQRSFAGMILQIPTNIPPEAQIVLQALFACFEHQKSVQEGLIGDLLWGFQQNDQTPIPAELTMNGLKQLGVLDYVKFRSKDHMFIDFSSDRIEEAFVIYQPKLLDFVYGG